MLYIISYSFVQLQTLQNFWMKVTFFWQCFLKLLCCIFLILAVVNATASFLLNSLVGRTFSARRLLTGILELKLNKHSSSTRMWNGLIYSSSKTHHFCNQFFSHEDLGWTKKFLFLWGTLSASHFFHSINISCLVSSV